MKACCSEGDWFAVPLAAGGFAACVAARVSTGGGVILGYFFGPGRRSPPAALEVAALHARDAALVARVGDYAVFHERWKFVGHVDEWRRDHWPMPQFVRYPPLVEHALLVTYDDEDPGAVVREQRVPLDDAKRYLEDGLTGSSLLEEELSDLL